MRKYQKPVVTRSEIDAVISPAYRELWNSAEQKKIDDDIEKNRKAENEFQLPGSARGREVKVEQLTHDFIFGAHIFNFDQLGTVQRPPILSQIPLRTKTPACLPKSSRFLLTEF